VPAYPVRYVAAPAAQVAPAAVVVVVHTLEPVVCRHQIVHSAERTLEYCHTDDWAQVRHKRSVAAEVHPRSRSLARELDAGGLDKTAADAKHSEVKQRGPVADLVAVLVEAGGRLKVSEESEEFGTSHLTISVKQVRPTR